MDQHMPSGSENLQGHGKGTGKGERLQLLIEGAHPDVNWTYGIFWQLSPDPKGEEMVLGWGDGHYQEPKHREAINFAAHNDGRDEVQRMRLKVVRELQALVCNKGDEVAVQMDHVSDTEWFYLVSMSYSFQRGVGTPGQALANGDYVWLLGADKVSDQVCTRSELAKLAGMQTIVCVVTKNGVVELGSTEFISWNGEFVNTIKAMFDDGDEKLKQVGANGHFLP